ncbi:hypothetical protein, variant [Aphanomyces astaci]|uniref:DUF7802 domain-containing protein n=1 Tax=Aphanomyces astaci TaxID=112090 RepID=W4G1H6_APHAT|nr:hypothetical protein, variant [Aphanomyces astaci]ETV73126.1 hypothetical protein, variant [Aphanomyces astaci]|eukprot:XP_009837330.1 hypothetical protein, variant [Aphanomyces astaci]
MVLNALVSFNSPLQLVLDNYSLVMIEIVSYFIFLMTCVHASASPRRTQLVLGGLVAFHTLYFGLGQLDPTLAIMWHGQALIMLFYSHVPVYAVLLFASLYYLAYIATLKLHLHLSSSIAAVGLLTLALVFPAELVGSKLLWWTWHDTDETLDDRFLNVPLAALASHAFSASSFYLLLHLLREYLTFGLEFQPANATNEYLGVGGATLLSFPLSTLAFGLTFQLFHGLLDVSTHTVLAALIVVATLWVWSSDRRGGDVDKKVVPWQYDGEWHHLWFDHALVQWGVVYLALMPLLLVVVTPSHMISLGYHQLLGDCSHVTTYSTLFGTPQSRFTYLCHLHFDEAYSFCEVPRSQLHVGDPWYKICGVGYPHGVFPNYLVVCVVVSVTLLLVLRDIFTLSRPAWIHRLPRAETHTPVKVGEGS